MMITLQEAHAKLPQLIADLPVGGELLITENDRAVAKIVRQPADIASTRKPGLCKGAIFYMASDFDAPLGDLKEYME